ncbi:hypothetical protein F8M41_002504 [Gigaspora margarita]|uniref:Uncharacterized protein n=1 Tax=Gigaspora margarita TaxID=4874 RepID=A0A8H4A6Z0_GIGMA|nr:hypothetical protein F8M41_002504 [Gigaspora margarita]
MSNKFEIELNKNIGSWKKLYEDVLAHFNIRFEPEPLLLQTVLQTDVQIFESDLVIDLNEFFQKFENKINAQIIRIYGDVVQLSDDLEIQMLESHGIILMVARRFETKQGCQISIKYKEQNHFQLLIYTIEMPSELIIKNEDKDSLKFKINSPNFIGGLISLDIALFYDNRKVTRSILEWIIKISEQLKYKEEKEFEMGKKLYYRALRMLELLNDFIEREKSKFTFVPRLNMETYKNHICQLIEFAKGYENEFKDVLRDEYNNKQKIKELNYKLLDYKDMTKMHEILQEKESKRFESAHNLTKETENKLQENKNDTANALEEFKEGVDDWLKEKKNAAQKELCIAIIELSLSVGKVVIQPGGVLSFVDTVKKVSKSVQEVLENINIENIKKLANITDDEDVKKELDLAKDINKKADKIKEITKNLKSSYNIAGELNKSTEEMSKTFEDFINKNISER